MKIFSVTNNLAILPTHVFIFNNQVVFEDCLKIIALSLCNSTQMNIVKRFITNNKKLI